jgi:hypothetical protein
MDLRDRKAPVYEDVRVGVVMVCPTTTGNGAHSIVSVKLAPVELLGGESER